jgi:endogenous inhibitor of DNA gyrase (YacG/DUF329 family)
MRRTLTKGGDDVNARGPTRRQVDSLGARRYDGAVKRDDPANARRAHCPHCGAEIAWYGNPHRPFCSLTCRLIDLGVWLDERYRVPGADLSTESTGGDGVPHGGG